MRGFKYLVSVDVDSKDPLSDQDIVCENAHIVSSIENAIEDYGELTTQLRLESLEFEVTRIDDGDKEVVSRKELINLINTVQQADLPILMEVEDEVIKSLVRRRLEGGTL